jgi:hypothetical protein
LSNVPALPFSRLKRGGDPFACKPERLAAIGPQAHRQAGQVFPDRGLERLEKLVPAVDPIGGVPENPLKRNVAVMALQKRMEPWNTRVRWLMVKDPVWMREAAMYCGIEANRNPAFAMRSYRS